MTCIRIHFFQCGSRIQIRIRIEIKWIVSAGIPYLKAEKTIQSSDHGLEFPVVSQVTYFNNTTRLEPLCLQIFINFLKIIQTKLRSFQSSPIKFRIKSVKGYNNYDRMHQQKKKIFNYYIKISTCVGIAFSISLNHMLDT